MRSLNIEGKKTTIDLRTMGQEMVKSCYVVSGLEVSSLSGENTLELPPVFTQVDLPVTRKDVTLADDLRKWSHLREVPIDTIDSDVGLLIGVNVPKAMEPWDVIPSFENGPFAVKTLLGWVINGPLDNVPVTGVSSRFVSVNRIAAVSSPSLEEQVRNQFDHDFSERTIDDVIEPSREDKQFLEAVTNSIQFKDGHYVIGLPFKADCASVPNNRKQAEQRMISINRRFAKDEAFCNEYKGFMEKVIDKGYARKVPADQLQRDDGRVWYLPHHGVYHPRKKKLRVVMPASYDFSGGDISKQVTEYEIGVHLFGATSSPSCSNFALRKTAQDCKEQFNAEVVDTVLRNFYVDDCLKSLKSVDSAVSLVKDLQALLNCGGFHIAKWISNSREVMSYIPVSERAKEVKDLDLDQDVLPIERALGVQWCVESDAFCFHIGVKEQPLTRRGILSMVSSVYDPLGFLAPLMLKAKVILQELCKLELEWDQQIPEKFSSQWRIWLQDLDRLASFKIARCVKPQGFGQVQSAQLHHFSDASETGYGTVSYLRLTNEEGKSHCSFIMGKSRVAPLKQTTIPRLELTAATVAVRTDKMLKGELDIPIDRTVFWTDSMAVLRYIWNTTSRFHTFVANRLTVIHGGSLPSDWRYVNTKLNPADLASRGLPVDSYLRENQWIVAPAFLWEEEDKWPNIPSEISAGDHNDDPEVKKVAVRAAVTGLSTVGGDIDAMSELISYHSSWFVLKRSLAWILKVRRELLRRVRHKEIVDSEQTGNNQVQPQEACKEGFISVQDMNEAEEAIIRYAQRQAFADEIVSLSSGQVKKSSKIRKLDPITDNGLLRVGGRLSQSNMPAESKHPVILPKNSPVSDLVLRQIHHDLKHSGRNHMLARLRQRYWLVNAPSAIRRVIAKCVICRKQRSPVGEQKMSNLPEDRLVPDEPPFTRVGVDYFGPFEVKQRRSRVKRYGVIFTCLTSRAIHLEIAASLDTDSYINALRRFIARRGQVTKMRSDNGTNFVGAERELARAISDWNLSQIHDSMLQRNVDWQFNPPAGSHHGGVWERMIRTVRKVMNSVLREQTLDEEGLHTLLCEVESTINDRPITKSSDQHCDLEALTPNHLLLMKRKPNLPPGVFGKTDNYCRRRWRQVQYLASLFWQRWLREYLPLLQERQKWRDEKRSLKVGDVVLIVDSNAPRNSWPMGLVQETIPDRLGVVRQAKIKTSTNMLVRPIDKLCLILEMD
ncbi:PREDICTED: uncharacterized protein LOC106807320 [Priapulus caudatus]|uniref:Uncharacterized protein LOC106807320 n=1 Tax=Priapulus caudatus TaxID=37621 RepID=A0ABM1DYU6_PRICU|nr:PREDICTED: uncharacterized protein LOC106807320 [Priapulus caudatus]